jgi:hypothetical protein
MYGANATRHLTATDALLSTVIYFSIQLDRVVLSLMALWASAAGNSSYLNPTSAAVVGLSIMLLSGLVANCYRDQIVAFHKKRVGPQWLWAERNRIIFGSWLIVAVILAIAAPVYWRMIDAAQPLS